MTNLSASQLLELQLARFRKRRPMRAGSLIITLYGDTISQHGNSAWLGSVINALQPFGLSQRLVRTAVYRLIQDNWLSSEQVGRRSYYSLTEFGLRHYQKAARRIYAAEHSQASGEWLFVYLSSLPDREREQLRKELRWLGFGNLFPAVMAKPGAERRSLDETLRELGLHEQVMILRSQPDDLTSEQHLRKLVYECWNLSELEQQYRSVWEVFQPIYQRLKQGDLLSPEQAFQLRTLLIHEYRRLLLKDVELPSSLLPASWIGTDVQNLAANLYRKVHSLAEQFVVNELETVSGALPPASKDYFTRFGGLS
ncbi:phenylacetic acid degradation operon negative regulatory protein PaaX [Porticoccaceae bacterium LTM1]|nr:phenylacetic acid degradation operon negative regulatory protein PaaX [Porticoccaceae bacterium LTM1]